MREVNLAGIDLNLLVALDALLAERSVTRAADRVGLSQPAMSRVLGRLRALFGDRLLVRSSAGLIPTPRAEALAPRLRAVLAEVGRIVQPPGFDPATVRGTARLAMPDYLGLLVLPALLHRLEREAPGLDIVLAPPRAGTLAELEAGDLDLAVGNFPQVPAGFFGRTVMTDGFACLARRGHPALAEPLTPERFAGLRHALITIRDDRSPGAVDEALARRGLTRRIALRVPNFLAAPLIVAETDLILTLPRRLAHWLAGRADVQVVEPPLELGTFAITQLWHERRRDDPEHAWLRATLAAAIAPTG
ncbi:MAG TPA: LysR family transcriptional regulator [Azospirillum sp.]|nr:LysR family transcriptional regulator [Azospirillum sp.]